MRFPKTNKSLLPFGKFFKMEKVAITVQAFVSEAIDKCWDFWTQPEHITQWNNASDEWHTPHATNDLRVGGAFSFRMEARDGSMGFDMNGVYTAIQKQSHIEYRMEDDRLVKIRFESISEGTQITETFEAETENSVELQRGGWQAILDSFKKYTEAN